MTIVRSLYLDDSRKMCCKHPKLLRIPLAVNRTHALSCYIQMDEHYIQMNDSYIASK